MQTTMRIIDRGSGTPLVIVPGVQGRWEFFAPAVDALARSFRVITFSLCGELGAPRIDRQRGIDSFADQIEAALDARGIDRAVICGVSFGGVAALRFAATRPERTTALILVSTPGPGFHLKKRHQLYARLPWIFAPVFLAETPRRLRREIVRAIPTRRARVQFALWQLGTILRAPVMLGRMGERAALVGTVDFAQEAARISSPTLVVSGDPGLDYVVPPSTTSAYAGIIGNAKAVTLGQTGHIGCVTRPEAFAAIVGDFVAAIGRQHHAA
jgi:pimeloyl-ACP methyl ester carboxylesterase